MPSSAAALPTTHTPSHAYFPPSAAGGILGAVNNWANLGEISNSIAIWLGISPPDIFFYAFLPPLGVDAALRLDFFMFSKVGLARAGGLGVRGG